MAGERKMGGEIRFFDSHAHYNDEKFASDRDTLLLSLLDGPVCGVMNVGNDLSTSLESIALAERYPEVYAAVGVHPSDAAAADLRGEHPEDAVDVLKTWIHAHPKVRAIGEIGFDFHYDPSQREVQCRWMRAQMDLAAEVGLPVIIHDREAHGATLEVIADYPKVRGVFHSFSGSAEMAADLVRRGWYISFSGPITYRNATRLAEAVRAVPADRLLIETDCPYLPPEPFRGQRNDSEKMLYTARRAAELRGISLEELADLTIANARRLFDITV